MELPYVTDILRRSYSFPVLSVCFMIKFLKFWMTCSISFVQYRCSQEPSSFAETIILFIVYCMIQLGHLGNMPRRIFQRFPWCVTRLQSKLNFRLHFCILRNLSALAFELFIGPCFVSVRTSLASLASSFLISKGRRPLVKTTPGE